jgi:hypothetical protein
VKKPQSLYLPVLPHNRLTGYVERALGGKGTLSGLIAFVEERTAAMLAEETAALPMDHPASAELTGLTLLDYRHLHQPLDTYTHAWNRFTSALPWFEDHAVGAHMLALHALTEYPSLWDSDYRKRDRTVHPLLAYSTDVTTALDALRNPRQGDRTTGQERPDMWRRPRPVFGRDRIDLITEARREPVSVYLDAEAHKTVYQAFGNTFFERLEHSLIHALENPDAIRDIEAAALFLEVGADGIDLDELEVAAHQIARTFAMYGHVQGREWVTTTDEAVERLARSAGYASLNDPALLSHGLEKLYLRRRDVARTIGLDIWHVTPEMSDAVQATLNLGNDLGLIDGTDLRSLPQRVAETLGERFGITEITPTRENAFRLLASLSEDDDVTADFINAVDLHMWGLFMHYARHCLPHVSPGHTRVSRSTLATLAEGDLFPHLAALEAFTGANVTKTPAGTWELRKGRRDVLTLENREALRVGAVLRQLVTLRDPITVDGDWEDELTSGSAPKPEAYSYPVGLAVIERTRHALSIHGPDAAAAALRAELREPTPQPKRRAPTSKTASRRGGTSR